jgi:mycofactocin glycosyltransferase
LRPTVDVVVPFRGSEADLEAAVARLGGLALGPGDSVSVVIDGSAPRAVIGAVSVLGSQVGRTPGRARNLGAAAGSADWIAFLDADVEPPSDLLDRYFVPEPSDAVGVLAGGVQDEAVPADAPAVARYFYIRGATSQDDTFRFDDWGFPKTANVAVRRSAFDAVGGFREDIRAADDADLSYRLRSAGWVLERRERASVVHHGRQTLRSFVSQKAVHGSGGAWLERRYPGSFPARRPLGLLWWALRTAAGGLVAAARARDRDRALWALLEPVEALAFEFGRLLPNERPLPPRLKALERL